jgi:hypothetical protein
VEQVRSLPLIADREHKRNVLLPKWVPTVEAYLASGRCMQSGSGLVRDLAV